MSDLFLMWVEIIFDVLYLAAIWTIVVIMYKRKENLKPEVKKIGILFLISFLLLAIGDTGHVGFRVIAYGLGGVDGLGGYETLVGIGALATALTVTVFYMLVAEIWRLRFNREKDYIWWILMITGVVRLLIMIPAGNDWGSVITPLNWSLARNIPLMIQGLGIASIMLYSAIKHNDKLVKNISIFIFVSYICYMPVIFFVREIPMLGMLMMPKTLAYVAVALLALKLFKEDKV